MSVTSTPDTSSSLSGKDIILPTRDALIDIHTLLGPIEELFTRSGFDTHTLIEYCVNQWTAMKLDEELIDFQVSSLLAAVTGTAIVDFALENSDVKRNGVDRIALEAGIRMVCYYVFTEIIPEIESLNLSPEQIYSVEVVKWLGKDLVIRSRPGRSHCRLTAECNIKLASLLQNGDP